MKRLPFGAVFSVISIGLGYRVEFIIGAFFRLAIEILKFLWLRTVSAHVVTVLSAIAVSCILILYILNSISLKKSQIG